MKTIAKGGNENDNNSCDEIDIKDGNDNNIKWGNENDNKGIMKTITKGEM